MKTWWPAVDLGDRLLVGLGFVVRTGIFLFIGFKFVMYLRFAVQGRPLRDAIEGLVVLIGLASWLLRKGRKHYRTWAVIAGIGLGTYAAIPPCWLSSWIPAPDGGAPYEEGRAIYTMRDIQAAAKRFHTENDRYGDLIEINPERRAILPFETIAPPYNIKLVLSGDRYSLTGQPHFQEEGYGCRNGCPRYRYFFGDETGILRSNHHCVPADASSPVLK